jgi:hypothetical protein
VTKEEKRALKDRIQAEELQRVKEAENCAPPKALTAATVRAVGEEGKPRSVMGRPSEYTEEEGDRICAWIAEGKSLRSYSRATGRDLTTIYRWLRERGDFHKRYARAHDDRADTLADEMVDIADEAARGTMEEIQAARLRVDTRKWIAAKLKPTKWGDIQVAAPKTNVTFNIGLPQRTVAHAVIPTIDLEAVPVLEQPADN